MSPETDPKSRCRVLLTSGGTRVPIDAVRWIGNHSTGRLGSYMAASLLRAGAEVTHLHAIDAQVPFRKWVDLRTADSPSARTSPFPALGSSDWERYVPLSFITFDDYAGRLESLLEGGTRFPFDLIILAAAVSDYRPALPFVGKISSQMAEQTISLVQTPKLIEKVRAAAPDSFLVGFKLTSGRTADETQAIGRQSLRKIGAQTIVANDLDHVDIDEHVLHLVRETDAETLKASDLPGGVEELAEKVVSRLMQWQSNRTVGA